MTQYVSIPGDGAFLVTREVACVDQRLPKENPTIVRVWGHTYGQQLKVYTVSDELLIVTFEMIEHYGVVETLDWIKGTLERVAPTALYIPPVEAEPIRWPVSAEQPMRRIRRLLRECDNES